jgi:hypothetical protein
LTICKQLVIDNAQSFYSKPLKSVPTFYSARKFFGVPDGALLYVDEKLKDAFEQDISIERMSHLLIRKDISAEAGYNLFVANDRLLDNQSIKKMSNLTHSILKTIDYKRVSIKRRENFLYLDSILKNDNKLNLRLEAESVPMVYPFWTSDLNLKKRLLENKIYTPTYWPNINNWCKEESLEYKLTNEVIYLPIDQRYDIEDMKIILKYV